MLFKSQIFCYNRKVPKKSSNYDGVWRSLVARSAGGREVAGSNPVTPILTAEIKGFRYFKMSKVLDFLIIVDYLTKKFAFLLNFSNIRFLNKIIRNC